VAPHLFFREIPFAFSGKSPWHFLNNDYLCIVKHEVVTIMKKTLLTLMGSVLLMSSCGTYTGEGAATGAAFGSILGSAIGGISGGWRGHDIGTIVGMAGGAAIGAAVGAAADQREQQKYEAYQRDRYGYQSGRGSYGNDRYGNGSYSSSDDSGFDATNSGDDRIVFDGAGPQGSSSKPETIRMTSPQIEICNARFIDGDNDGVMRPGEECRVVFEVMNRSSVTLYDVQPTVIDVSGNKHIQISPNLHVESIAPNTGIRYTATILPDKKLKDGEVVIQVGVNHGNKEMTNQMKKIIVQTRKR
jgi:hypothetical protein